MEDLFYSEQHRNFYRHHVDGGADPYYRALVYLLGTRAYLGLGVWSPIPGDPTIAGFFQPGTDHWSWALKLLFTVVTLSAGFKGGEVTPLFFIGAALGNALGWLLGAPLDLFAALGFVAVFAGAAMALSSVSVMANALLLARWSPPGAHTRD